MEKNSQMQEGTGKKVARRDNAGGMPRFSIWYALGGVAAIGIAALIVATYPDIKRYIRISTM